MMIVDDFFDSFVVHPIGAEIMTDGISNRAVRRGVGDVSRRREGVDDIKIDKTFIRVVRNAENRCIRFVRFLIISYSFLISDAVRW